MYPILPSGAQVRARPPATGEPRVGQIVLFQIDGSLTAHRILCRSAANWVTKGDASPRRDPNPLARKEVLGVVEEVEWERRTLCLDTGLWRGAGYCIAASSRILDWKARIFLPATWLSNSTSWGRLVRKGLGFSSRLVPCTALLILGRGKAIPESRKH